MNSTATIGLCLTETETQAVELSLEDVAVPSILAIGEWRGGLQDSPGDIVRHLLAFVQANTVGATRVAVTLDTSALFAHVLPVPPGQDETLMRKHAQWDLAQLFPEASSNEFITDVHLLGTPHPPHAQRLLSVSIKRSLARALEEALAGEGFSLHVLDGDHFSAEHFLLSRHPLGDAGLGFLFGLKQNRIDVSILHDGTLVDYLARDGFSAELCDAAITECVLEHGEPRRIFLYGPHATPATIEALQANGQAGLTVLNPFSGMRVLPDTPLVTHFLAEPNRFVPAVGAALREE
jgi:Tfp pilus assembly PilM family ATPase